MASDYRVIEGEERPRNPLKTTLVIALVAFLLGLIAMGLALRQWGDRLGVLGSTPVAAPGAPVAGAISPGIQVTPQPVQTAPATPASLDALTQRVRELELRIARIGVSAQAASGNASRAEGLLVAFAARRALDRGVALGYIEAQLRARFGESQPRAVAMVIAAARQPVTLEQLQLALNDLGPDLVTGGSRSWWEGFKREMSGLIVVRKEGTPSPLPSDRLQRAKRQLEGGQVDAALAEVARMPGRAQAENWMANARRYIEARRALDIIETAAILAPRDAAAQQPAPEPEPIQTAPAT